MFAPDKPSPHREHVAVPTGRGRLHRYRKDVEFAIPVGPGLIVGTIGAICAAAAFLRLGHEDLRPETVPGAISDNRSSTLTSLQLHLYSDGPRRVIKLAVIGKVAVGETPKIMYDGELELVHAQQLAKEILNIISERRVGDVTINGVPMTVSALLEKISHIAHQYRNQIVPDLRTGLDLDVFNTYRSYLYPAYYPVSVKLHTDSRGSLFEVIKSLNGGQSFISTTKPGITRGNHFHTRKVERFCVLGGEAVIRIRRLFSSQVLEFPVSGELPQYIDIPTLHTHNITNTGPSELTTLFWAHEIFDPEHPDTLVESV